MLKTLKRDWWKLLLIVLVCGGIGILTGDNMIRLYTHNVLEKLSEIQMYIVSGILLLILGFLDPIQIDVHLNLAENLQYNRLQNQDCLNRRFEQRLRILHEISNQPNERHYLFQCFQVFVTGCILYNIQSLKVWLKIIKKYSSFPLAIL